MGHRQRPRQRMHAALDILEAALPMADPVEAYSVTHNALGSAIKVIARADDSSGIIGDACRRLLELHPKVAAAAHVAAAKPIYWMMTFQFAGSRSTAPPAPRGCRHCGSH